MNNNDTTIIKWFLALFMVIAVSIAGGYTAYSFAQAKNISVCVKSGGSWTDINPKYNVDMGCVNK